VTFFCLIYLQFGWYILNFNNGSIKKRKRGANFSPFEKSTLLNLVHKYKNIVSNNKTDAVAVEEKEKCWKRITEEFNFESPNGILPLGDSKLNSSQNSRNSSKTFP
jgi:hypothetical protein